MQPECAPLFTSHLLGKKFFIPLLEEINHNSLFSFNAFRRKTKITAKVLSERLKEMEESKLIEKKQSSYRATSKGKSLLEIVQKMKEFHVKFHDVPATCTITSCADCQIFSPSISQKINTITISK